jgi:hypothetical protein
MLMWIIALPGCGSEAPDQNAAVDIAAVDAGTCALFDGGQVRCWGAVSVTLPSPQPQLLELPAPARALVGGSRPCALLEDATGSGSVSASIRIAAARAPVAWMSPAWEARALNSGYLGLVHMDGTVTRIGSWLGELAALLRSPDEGQRGSPT